MSASSSRYFLRYVGDAASTNGITMDLEKVKALTTWPRPTILKELQSFLGISDNYCRFIKNFFHIVYAVTELPQGISPINNKKGNPPRAQYFNVSAPFRKWWTAECEEAFWKII